MIMHISLGTLSAAYTVEAVTDVCRADELSVMEPTAPQPLLQPYGAPFRGRKATTSGTYMLQRVATQGRGSLSDEEITEEEVSPEAALGQKSPCDNQSDAKVPGEHAAETLHKAKADPLTTLEAVTSMPAVPDVGSAPNVSQDLPLRVKLAVALLQHGAELSLGFCVKLRGADKCARFEHFHNQIGDVKKATSMASLVMSVFVFACVAVFIIAIMVTRRPDLDLGRGVDSLRLQSMGSPGPSRTPGKDGGQGVDAFTNRSNSTSRPPTWAQGTRGPDRPNPGYPSEHPHSQLAVDTSSPMLHRHSPQISTGDLPAPSSDNPEDYLCPDLVVPPNCECTVLVPMEPQSQGVYNVMDMQGNLMFQVATGTGQGVNHVSNVHTRSAGFKDFALMLDHTCVLAKCAAEPNGAAFSIAKPNGIRFARIALHRDGNFPGNHDNASSFFLLTTARGALLYFSGDISRYSVRVCDATGGIMADTEPTKVDFDRTTDFFRLRVASTHDVGLVLCSLFAIRAIGA